MEFEGENLNAWSRSAVVTASLLQGEKLTTEEVAELVGVVYTTALRMMKEISCVLPFVRQERYDGRWEAIK